MSKDEKLSAIFNRVSNRHNLIKKMDEQNYKFMTENTFLEVHCIDYIEKIQDPNVTKLSKALRVTRGAISKTTKRLVASRAISKYQKAENKKEIYYKLTDKGKEIYLEHEAMHRTQMERDVTFFSQLSEEEKNQMIDLLNKIYGEISKELKVMGLDNYI